MKFTDLPVGNYFSFVREDNDSAVVLQKFANSKFRYANGSGITVYRKNETVEDLGEKYQRPELIKFNQLDIGHYFVFHERRTVYEKISKYHIRRFRSTEVSYYNSNEKVQILDNALVESTNTYSTPKR